jgi:nucleoid-associated protein YgaU
MPPAGSVASRFALSRPLPWVIGIAALIIAGLVAWDWRIARQHGAAPLPVASSPPATTASPPPARAPATPSAPPGPSFDIVRINPRGDAVMAGRATPGADVVLRDGDRDLGRARADAQGNWVFLPAQPLAPGARELSIVERVPGGEDRRSEATVLLVVPDEAAKATGTTAMAVLSAPGAAPRMLQGPEPSQATPPAASTPAGGVAPTNPLARTTIAPRLGVDAVDYDERGEVRFAGTAEPGATLRLYVDNQPVGDAQADALGRWTLAPEAPVAAGDHTLRLDQVGAGGRVGSRVELPFHRQARSAADEGRVVVQPGQSLWQIARQAYGQGTRFTVIYAANKDTIRDPRLIYPGQTFTLPTPNTANSR